jgi:hypothetical protein
MLQFSFYHHTVCTQLFLILSYPKSLDGNRMPATSGRPEFVPVFRSLVVTRKSFDGAHHLQPGSVQRLLQSVQDYCSRSCRPFPELPIFLAFEDQNGLRLVIGIVYSSCTQQPHLLPVNRSVGIAFQRLGYAAEHHPVDRALLGLSAAFAPSFLCGAGRSAVPRIYILENLRKPMGIA